jgi:hypothetical protein
VTSDGCQSAEVWRSKKGKEKEESTSKAVLTSIFIFNSFHIRESSL